MQGRVISYVVAFVPGIITLLGACASDIARLLGYGESWLVTEYPFRCTFVLAWRIGAGVAGATFAVWAFHRQQIRPFKDFQELRIATFRMIFGPLIAEIREEPISKDLRFSIMRAHYWIRLGRHIQVGRLVPVYHFDGEDRRVDRGLCYRFVKIFRYEKPVGYYARAFLSGGNGCYKALDAASPKQYNLTEEMTKLTEDLTFFACIPVSQNRGRATPKYVGLINLDSSSDQLARTATGSKEYAETLMGYFADWRLYVGLWL